MKSIGFGSASIALSGTLFDCFGISPALDLGDTVEAEFTRAHGDIRLIEIINNPGLPMGDENIVQAVAKAVVSQLFSDRINGGKTQGINLRLIKGMKFGTGLGSSAASSIATVKAVCGLFDYQVSQQELIALAVVGEKLVTGAYHYGNIIPAATGGTAVILGASTTVSPFVSPPKYQAYAPPGFYLTLVQPDIVIETRMAREMLWQSEYDMRQLIHATRLLLSEYIGQPADDAGQYAIEPALITAVTNKPSLQKHVKNYLNAAVHVANGFIEGDMDKVGYYLEQDQIVTGVRNVLIKGYDAVKQAAFDSGAKGFCICGSGPTVFALSEDEQTARLIGKNTQQAFVRQAVDCEFFLCRIDQASLA